MPVPTHTGREGQAGVGQRQSPKDSALPVGERRGEDRAGVTDWDLCLGDTRSEERMERLSCFSCGLSDDPMDCSPPGSSVHGILQARILEWVAMLSSRGSS